MVHDERRKVSGCQRNGLLLVDSYGIQNRNVGEVESQAAICKKSKWWRSIGLVSNYATSGIDSLFLCSAPVVVRSAHVWKIELAGKRCVRRA